MPMTEVLAPWIEKVVKDVLEADHLHRDDDGDIPIPLDRTVMYVRLSDGPNGMPRVRIFGPLLKEVEATPALFERLNNVNRDGSYLRFYVLDDVIWGSMELVAESFRQEDLANALGAADFYSEKLGTLLGIPDAKTWRDETADAVDRNSEDKGGTPEGTSHVHRTPKTPRNEVARATASDTALPHHPSPSDEALNLRMGYL